MAPPTLAVRCALAARRLLPLMLALAAALPQARAGLPAGLASNALYEKGYLDVTLYQMANGTPASQVVTAGDITDPATITATTAGINQALQDAYDNNVALYFPSGTYVVNDTLKAITKTGWDGLTDDFATPRNHIAIVGSTKAGRPLIKLAAGAAGFGDANSPKALLEFRNLDKDNSGNESSGQGYHQMLRGVDLDCSGHPGAIGLYFSQAQNSSIENVGITATGAFTGLKGGLPHSGTGVVNIEIEGGQYGIDTVSPSGAASGGSGSVIAGAVLKNQTVSAVRHRGFAPLTFVGFEIVTPAGSNQAAVTIDAGFNQANFAAVHLIDGIIWLGGAPAVAAIDNRSGNGKNFYARNVYITGGDQLVRSGANPAVSGTGAWKLINEYSHCNQDPVNVGKTSWDLIDGTPTRAPGPLNNGEVLSVIDHAPPPPDDLIDRHVWAALPSVDDSDAVDASTLGIVPGNVSSAVFQGVIDSHRKIFLRKGVYFLDGTITLRNDTILFGADRNLTRIEVQSGWNPTSETAIITTVNDATATTYLGDLSIGVDATDLANDWFVALDWQAGRDSMVHIGQVYRAPAITSPKNRKETNPHSLLRVRHSGGGRWYFTGAVKAFTSQHPDFRILKADGTTEPLWFYGLNPEHPSGCDAYVEFKNSSNIRIYSVKSEFYGDDTLGSESLAAKSVVLKFDHVANVALYGHGAIRNGVNNRGAVEFIGSDRVVATLIAPQISRFQTDLDDTLREIGAGGRTGGVAFPDVVALYKRGEITAADETVMRHADVSYGPVGSNVPPLVRITSPADGATIPLAATTIAAAASDSDGIVALAEFYANGAFIADDTTSPYGVSWTPAVAGSYRLTAIVMDDRGAITMSDTVRVTATSMPAPTPAPSSGGRGGGGAPSLWFVAALSLLGAARFARSGAAASEVRDL